jgi:hypothetical protein
MFKPLNSTKCASDHFVRIMPMINKICQPMLHVSFFFFFSIHEEHICINMHHITLPCYPLEDIEFNYA